ncbi:hypothetical protein [Mesorhizobium escarrei]|uniref:Uncharacterized protein n=1 Tax=Mesorhizobium escarrei TaxID=666018 RepID=A0ABM9DH79_9HYPH|nr:hypothetical protein [Mesorhizobium escarrei]CAH2395939.1 conserved hypothetical protein [Mesorhizobium escarrei]
MTDDPFDDEPADATKPRPSGRPKRAKKALADGFLEAIRADFRAHGASVIAEVRTEKPDQYLKIVLSVLPKDLHLNINNLEALSDDEIRQRIRGLEAVLRPFLEKSGVAGLARPGSAKPGLAKPGLDGEDRVSEPAQGIGPQAPR